MIRILTLLVLTLTAYPAIAQIESLQGRWTVRSAGQPIMIVELSEVSGKFSATILQPANGTINHRHEAVDLSGPVLSTNMGETKRHANSIEFAENGGSSAVNVLTFVDRDFVALSYKNRPFFDPILLSRARPDENIGRDWSARKTWLLDQPWPDNPQLKQMFNDDQAIRKDDSRTDWAVAQAEDAERRKATQRLLEEGKLHSGTDFYNAAFIFQHGQESGDYLKAHALATIAAAKGRRDAVWIAAATLDRYLQSIGQKQVYGTQYLFPTDNVVTQEPFDRTLFSDTLRALSRVPDLAAQEQRRKEIEASFSK